MATLPSFGHALKKISAAPEAQRAKVVARMVPTDGLEEDRPARLETSPETHPVPSVLDKIAS